MRFHPPTSNFSTGRRVSFATFLAAIMACMVSGGAADVPSNEWPRWRGASGDGRWNPKSLPADWAQREPVRMWHHPVGGGFGGVTVGNSRVYVMDRQKQPREVERLLCFAAEDGTALWQSESEVAYGKMDYGTGPRSSVTVHDGRVYALGATGVVLCADAATGRQVWRRDTVRDFGAKIPAWGFAASPVIDGERVLLHVGAGKEGALLALNRSTGEEVWRGGVDHAGYCTPEIITHANQRQLILWGPEHIQSLVPETGRLNWKHPYKITYGVSIAQPVYHGGVLLVSGYWHGAKALKLGAGSGEVSLLWENEKDMCGLMSAPLLKDGVVYLLDKNRGLQAVELRSGRILWSDDNTLSPADRNPQMSLVWMAEENGLAALLNSQGELVFVSLSPEGRRELGRKQLLGRTWAHPAFAGGRVFARSDSELVAWRLW
jgi:outer membrane protein assembly factor BamB